MSVKPDPTFDHGVLEAVLARLYHALGAANSPAEVAWALTNGAIAHLGLEDCVVYLLEADGSALSQCAAFGPKQAAREVLESHLRLPIGVGVVGCAAQLAQTQLVRDTRQDPRYVRDDAARLSELAVPICWQGKVIGVIDSEHSQLAFFTARHQQVFEALAELSAAFFAKWR